MEDRDGKVRQSKVCASQVKKSFEKEVVKLTMPSELPEALEVPEDVLPTSSVPVAAQA